MLSLKQSIRSVRRRTGGAFIVCLVSAALAATASAQDSRGAITGTVRDATKGLVPGATVTVVNTEMDTTATATIRS